MARLPLPGADEGQWGTILNDYLQQSHTQTGALKSNTVTAAQLTPGSVTTASIADSAVTYAKLHQSARDGVVNTARTAANTYTDQKVADLGDTYETKTHAQETYASKRWFDVTDYTNINAAVAALNAAGGGTLYVPRGYYTTTTGLAISVPAVVLGDGLTESIIQGINLGNSTDLLTVSPTGGAMTGFQMSGIKLAGGGRHNLHINNVRDFRISDVMTNAAGQDGFYTEMSWVGVFINCLAWANKRDGFNFATTSAHAMTLQGCHAIENVRHGINAPSISRVSQPTLEHNGGAGIAVIDRRAVVIDGGYFEDDTMDVTGRNHILISGSREISLRDVAALQYIPGNAAIAINNSSTVTIDGAYGTHALTTENAMEYGWSALSKQARGIVIGANCKDIELRRITTTPMYSSSPLIEPARFDGYYRTNILGAEGRFSSDSNGDGLANGWTRSGTPATSLATIDGRPTQVVTSSADWQAFMHPITLAPNTTYSIGAVIETNKEHVYFCTESAGIQLDTVLISPLNGPRIIVRSFTTGATPPTAVGVAMRYSATTVKIADVKVIKGDFNESNFPMFGQFESPTI